MADWPVFLTSVHALNSSPASEKLSVATKSAVSSSINAVTFSSARTITAFRRRDGPQESRLCALGPAALLIIQNRLRCGFAQFKLSAHLL
jgi:hypothetical protein